MRTRRTGLWLKLLSIATVLALLAGCGGGAKTTPPAPSTGGQTQTPAPAQPKAKKLDVTIAMWSPPNNFSAINTDSSYGYFAVEILFDTLVKLNDKLDVVPKLAEKWEASADLTKFKFYLNKNAKWHDGKPVTAKDVLFTVNLIANKDTTTNRAANLSQILGTNGAGKAEKLPLEGLKQIDDYTIEVTTKAAVSPESLMEKFGTTIFMLPEHILGKVEPKEISKDPFFMNPTVGSGPFKFVKYATDQYIEFARNDGYYLGKPILERVFVRLMQANAAVAALEKGEVDITAGSGIGEIPITDWDKVKALKNINAVEFASKGYQYMDFNHTRDYLKDPRVRQAFYYGINRKLIIDNLLKGRAEPLETMYTSVFKYVDKSLKYRDFDPKKAKELLTAAGWDFNRELELLVPTGNLVREQSAPIIIANLQEAGVKVKIQKMDFPTMQARRAKQDYDLSLVGWSSLFDPDVASQYQTGGVYNNGKYSNPKIDEFLTKGAVTAKFEDRKKIYDDFQQTIYNDPNVVFLYSPNALTAVAKRMVNVKMAAPGFLWNMEKWDVTE